MLVKDLKELWNSWMEVLIYNFNSGEHLFEGDLNDLEDETILNMFIGGIYDSHDGNEIDLEIGVY